MEHSGDGSSKSPFATFFRPAWFFWLCALFFVVVSLYRGGNAKTFWLDEIYSLQLVHLSFQEMILKCQNDVHPPLFYILLEGWIRALSSLGLGEGILQGRSLSAVVILMGMIGSRPLMTAIFRRTESATDWAGAKSSIIAGMILITPTFADAATDMRNYAVSFVCVFLGFLILMLQTIARRESWGRSQRAMLWALFAVILSIGLWSHLLVGLAIFLIGLIWLFTVVYDFFARDVSVPKGYFLGGTAAFLFVALSFTPWIQGLIGNVAYLDRVAPWWMSPINHRTIFQAFILNLFYGRNGYSIYAHNLWGCIFAGAIVLGILILYIRSKQLNRTPSPLTAERRASRFLILSALFLWIGFISLLIIISALELTYIFFAPRYPQIVMAVGIFSLFLMIDRVRISFPEITKFIIAFVLIAFAYGHSTSIVGSYREGLFQYVNQTAPDFTSRWDAGDTVYLYPDNMLPYYSGFDHVQLRPYSELPAEMNDDLRLLFFPGWFLETKEAAVIKSLSQGKHIDEARETAWDFPYYHANAYELRDPRPEDLALFLNPSPANSWPDIPPEAIRVVWGHDVTYGQGWHPTEFDQHMNSYAWGRQEWMTVRLPEPLTTGEYTMKLYGYRLAMEPPESELKIHIGDREYTNYLVEGGVQLTRDFRVPEGVELELIRLQHPTRQVNEMDPHKADNRVVSILFSALYVTPND